MTDVDELKQFALLHARAQNISGSKRILDRIDDSASWTREWFEEAERLRARGRLLAAVSHYIMARFPFVDGPARQEALDRCVDTFGRWAERNAVERLDLPILGQKIGCWSAGLSSARPRPFVLLCGGIVSSKEQWAPALTALRKLGFAGLVTEMPGVGENPLRYDADSWRMFPAILDAVADRADVSRTYAMTLSFSGHLALRCAAEDHRFRGVVTAGPPIREFFTDTDWQAALPSVTVDTLHHLAGGMPSAAWVLPPDLLASLDIPVACTASTRDEIIPDADVEVLHTEVGRLWLVENDDVHGSPHHVTRTRLWSMQAILRMHGGPALPLLALRTVLRLAFGAK